MPTHDLTGARLGQQTDGPLGGLYLAQVVNELSPFVLFRFTSTSDRDAKFATFVANGGTIKNGMSCWCDSPGAFYDRIGGAWVQRPGVVAPPAFAVGSTSANSDSSANITVTHGLGSVPSSVQVTNSHAAAYDITFVVVSVTSTQFTVKCYYNGTVINGAAMSFYWRVDA